MIKGMEEVLGNLDKSESLISRAGSDAAKTIAEDVRTTAIRSIQTVSTGHQVTRYTEAENPYQHLAADDGEAPNNDKGRLVEELHVRPKGQSWEAVSGAPYSADLELGTMRMGAKPFMVPASEKSRKKVPKVLQNAINRELAKL